MIVRISGEDQYRLDDADAERLNELEHQVSAAIGDQDEAAFARSLPQLLDFVRERGSVVADDELESSDVILPPGDVTLAEAAAEFSADGLIPE